MIGWVDGFHGASMRLGGWMMLLFWGGLIPQVIVVIRAFFGRCTTLQGRTSRGEGRAADPLGRLRERGGRQGAVLD